MGQNKKALWPSQSHKYPYYQIQQSSYLPGKPHTQNSRVYGPRYKLFRILGTPEQPTSQTPRQDKIIYPTRRKSGQNENYKFHQQHHKISHSSNLQIKYFYSNTKTGCLLRKQE